MSDDTCWLSPWRLSHVGCQMSNEQHLSSDKILKNNFREKILSDTKCQMSDVTLTIWGNEVMDVWYWIPTSSIICWLTNVSSKISYISCRISILCHLTNLFKNLDFCHMSGVICQMTSSECRTSEIKFTCKISEVGSENSIVWCELIYEMISKKIK